MLRAPHAAPARLLLCGCPELSKPLRDQGMGTAVVRSLRRLFEPAKDAPRAIVLGAEVLRGHELREVFANLRDRWPLVDVILWAPRGSGALVREALNAGAKDVLLSHAPQACARDIANIIAAQRLLPRAVRLGGDRVERSDFEGLVSRSRRMWDLFDTITQIAATDATVLILGETGTGKELVARAIHRRSHRRGRFVAINCGAVNPSLIDSELFGHVKGAFTGASADKAGLFKHAHGGTLLLDEIGNLPVAAQYHLLRALQEGAVRPVGGHEELDVDARVIAATSTKLEDDVREGRFREDLFYRLDVIRLEIPPLRERPEDILYLFAHFARTLADEYNVTRPELRDDFLDALVTYAWPGNVRQLQNFTERLVLTHAGRSVDASILRRLLPFKSEHAAAATRVPPTSEAPAEAVVPPSIDTSMSLEEYLAPRQRALEQAYLRACLHETKGRVGRAAARAGISRRTLLRKLRAYGLDKAIFRGAPSSQTEESTDTRG